MTDHGPGAWASTAADWVAVGLEAAGVAAVLLGVIVTSLVFLRDGFQAAGGWYPAYRHYRANLGRAVLLGLELLVAADIVHTVAAPLTLESIAALGLVVAIRTVLSLSLEVEIHGYWPWQRAARHHRDEAERNSSPG